MVYVMSNQAEIIIVAAGKVRYHQNIGFNIESKHGSYDKAHSAAIALENA